MGEGSSQGVEHRVPFILNVSSKESPLQNGSCERQGFVCPSQIHKESVHFPQLFFPYMAGSRAPHLKSYLRSTAGYVPCSYGGWGEPTEKPTERRNNATGGRIEIGVLIPAPSFTEDKNLSDRGISVVGRVKLARSMNYDCLPGQ